ncbi:hypothetical protein ES332_D01G155000v1 [Gossypium tomentosum]|uniref:Globin domain-containing protein n=1 Tax=Gossypium tomentosum TaxID=34277 RepID=A0A5D2MA01_GOSTO|nr:hypothetical protein ES332_D01G155000v1 [Gossypium tomentosum]TYH87970.1 hypothetical protein ES332_D01G155000v1 [Gossypium tomentosum]
MGFTEKLEGLVKESWEVLKQDIPHSSLRFFSLILEIAPGAKNMFSFLWESQEIPQNNPKLKAHAVKVFKMTCESAIQLREKGEVVVADTTLKYLGVSKTPISRGIMLMQVVKEALLRTIEEAIGEEKWNEEMKNGWGEAYDQLAEAIKAEMKNHHDETA